ncbi:MAG TPA: hypothetical protein VNO22_02225 [Planctomycetota bacterium]|jgi:hypothetical protein|nr:hypothetical protein [Planctomycetota bacterium]
MYLFKTSKDTIGGVLQNRVHAYAGCPDPWAKGEIILISKNRSDCDPGERQIQFVTRFRDVRRALPGEISKYWGPSNEGRWTYIIECEDFEELKPPFDLADVIGPRAPAYYEVRSFKRLDPRDEQDILAFLAKQGIP